MSARELNDWLTGYLEYTRHTEPPLSYHTWVGISLMAGALQRRVYLRWGHETIYPNMYVVLVGPSGKTRKGTAMNIGKAILSHINIPMTSESTTREALIRAMANASNQFIDRSNNNNVRFHCSLTCMSEELSVFLGQNDVKFLADLTDWYDSRDSWTYETKNSGTDKITGVCFNLLGATAPDWLQSILPEEAIGGGFTSRVIFVVEEFKGKTVAKHILTEGERRLQKMLKNDLERMVNVSGEIMFSPAAEDRYIAWYEEQEKKTLDNKPAIDDPRFAGYCDRRATHLRKLAIVISMSRGDKLVIEEADVDRARIILETTERKMPKVFGGLGKNPYSAITEKILMFIRMRKVVSRSVLMNRFYRDVDSGTLRMIEEVLTYMKVVRIVHKADGAEIMYEYIGKE